MYNNHSHNKNYTWATTKLLFDTKTSIVSKWPDIFKFQLNITKNSTTKISNLKNSFNQSSQAYIKDLLIWNINGLNNCVKNLPKIHKGFISNIVNLLDLGLLRKINIWNTFNPKVSLKNSSLLSKNQPMIF